MDPFDSLFIGFLISFSSLIACVFYFQRFLWRLRKRAGKHRLGFYPSSASMGNALQTLEIIAQPRLEYVLEEKLDDHEEEDDEAGPKDPTAHLQRQLKRIRNGEEVDSLTVLLRRRG